MNAQSSFILKLVAIAVMAMLLSTALAVMGAYALSSLRWQGCCPSIIGPPATRP